MADRLCLHCEISEILMRRQQAGEVVDERTIGRLCEVIADIANSNPEGPVDAFKFAHDFLVRFEAQIASGQFETSHELVVAPRKTVN
jgi:hypothetical protein